MNLRELQAEQAALQAERATLMGQGQCLQNCWLVQVKPGGTARTNRQYWQVRSRQPLFDGKKLKHLKEFEVEAYQAAIERGRALKRLDSQLAKLQHQLRQMAEPHKQLQQPVCHNSSLPALLQPNLLLHTPLPFSGEMVQDDIPAVAVMDEWLAYVERIEQAQIELEQVKLDKTELEPIELNSAAPLLSREQTIDQLIAQSRQLRRSLQKSIALKWILVSAARQLRQQSLQSCNQLQTKAELPNSSIL
jgi:hypothetical protein